MRNVGIDPSRHFMSATSFGEYKPVGRSETDLNYSREQILAANANNFLKSKNRRVELLVFYRNN
jgi:hypothetical protein